MKTLLLILAIFYSTHISAQRNKIDKSKYIPQEIDFTGCVKKITINNQSFNPTTEKIDTISTISEIHFNKQGEISHLKKYNETLRNLWQIVKFDDLGRITTVFKYSDGKKIPVVTQFFSTTTQFPDSTIIDNYANYREKYINHFKDDLVVRQDHMVNGPLQDYRIYTYNNQKQLIEDRYYNPKNPTNETVVFKSDNEMTVYPVSQILYEHQKHNDTLIVIRIRPEFSLREVTKKLNFEDHSLEIIEEYDREFLEKSRFIHTFKDSISDIMYHYDNNKEVKNYYKSFITQKQIISQSKTSGYGNNEERKDITKIETVNDEYNNWVRKIYYNQNQINRVVERKIEYYCH